MAVNGNAICTRAKHQLKRDVLISEVRNSRVPLYTLLKRPIPVNLLKYKGDTDVADIDKFLLCVVPLLTYI